MNCSFCGCDIHPKKGSFAWMFVESVWKGVSLKKSTFRACGTCVAEGKFDIRTHTIGIDSSEPSAVNQEPSSP